MLRSGLIAIKIGNSSYYHEDGKNTHVTVLKVDIGKVRESIFMKSTYEYW